MSIIVIPANLQHQEPIFSLTHTILGERWNSSEARAQISRELSEGTGRGRYYLLRSNEEDQAYAYLRRPEHTPRWIQLVRLINTRTTPLADIESLLLTAEYKFKGEFYQATASSPEGLFFQAENTPEHQADFYRRLGLTLGAREEKREVWVKKYL